MDRIRFTDYEKIVDYLQALRTMFLILTKYMEDFDNFEWVNLRTSCAKLESKLIGEFPDLALHFECKTPYDKLKSIDFLLKLFEIGRNAKLTI